MQPFNHSEFLTCGLLILVSTTCILFNYISTNPYSFRSSSAVTAVLSEVTESVRATVSGQSYSFNARGKAKLTALLSFGNQGSVFVQGQICPGEGSDAQTHTPAKGASGLHKHGLLIAISCTYS